jgi:hypothetical protein
LIIRGDGNALVDTFDLTHVDVLVQNLLVNKVHSPDADTVVVDSDKFLVSVVVESDLVGDVHADTMSDNSFARLDFPNDKLVVVLSAKRSQELLVLGEVEILDEHFVQLKAVQHRHGVEVPNDDISLESHMGLLA